MEGGYHHLAFVRVEKLKKCQRIDVYVRPVLRKSYRSLEAPLQNQRYCQSKGVRLTLSIATRKVCVVRRLEDQIRPLCIQALGTYNPEQCGLMMTRLRQALHEHITRFRARLANPYMVERRNQPHPRAVLLEGEEPGERPVCIVVIKQTKKHNDAA
jgi:hypothetical protein